MAQNYRDLLVWKKSHKAALRVLSLFQKAKKTTATYEIWKQCLRAAFSVPANIVEGFHSHTGKNFSSKLEIARGEAAEAGYWIFVLFEIKETDRNVFEELDGEYWQVIRMLTTMINKRS